MIDLLQFTLYTSEVYSKVSVFELQLWKYII